MSALVPALVVTIPIFALMGLGRWLRWRGWMAPEAQRFATQLVYWTSLPALIVHAVISRPLHQLLAWNVMASTMGATLLAGGLVLVACRLLRVRREWQGPLAAAAFWANVSYMGFPLAASAWPDDGMVQAGIVNAFTMPLFVIFGTALLVLGSGSGDGQTMRRQIRVALLNPIVGAAVVGLVGAGVIDLLGWREGPPAWLAPPVAVADRLLVMLGAMGLPLALICVGAALDPARLRGSVPALALGSAVKLVLTPLLTWLILQWAFPTSTPSEQGVAVLLMGTPVAVGCWVIASQLQLGEELLAALLVLTTLLSGISLSVWLLVLL